MKKVLVTGSQGMLGRALMESLSHREVTSYGVDLRDPDHRLDITKKDEVSDLINRLRPDVVIHTAAYTDVDGCERDPDRAYRVNSEGTKNLAAACKSSGVFLVYISTDFVFDGKKTAPYTEEDLPKPVNIYGESKLRGENFVKEILSHYLIIRTSWLFGEGGKNFVDTILANAAIDKKLKVVSDQCGSPTYTVDLAEAITDLALITDTLKICVLNVTNLGSCTWHEFAEEILLAKGIDDVIVFPIISDELDRPAKRPHMSILDDSAFEQTLLEKLPRWQDALRRYLDRGRG